MATENRTPDDLQEAVAATLRRLRGEVGKAGPTASASPQRLEPQLSVRPVSQETPQPPPGETPPPAPPAAAAPAAEPDLLSRAEPEIPPPPAPRPSIRETLASQGREPQPPRGGMRLVPYALAFAAIVVFAGIVWWAYQAVVGGQKNGPVPVITADNTPAKVAPADQNASDSGSQQQTIYNQISGGSANQPASETLLPAPDTPQTPPPPPTPTPPASDVAGTDTAGSTAGGATTTTGTDSGTANTAAATGGATTGTDTSGSTTQTLIPPAAPLAPGTSGTASSGTAGTDTGSTTATADSGSTATTGAATTGSTDTTSADSGSVNTDVSTDAGPAPYDVPTLSPLAGSAPDASAPAAAATVPSTGTTTTADAGSAATAGSVADNYRIQLAAVKSQADADKAWKRILAKHGDVLGSLTVHIVRADLGTQGVYYRVQAGPFADKASAQSVCEQLKSSGQQCLVKP